MMDPILEEFARGRGVDRRDRRRRSRGSRASPATGSRTSRPRTARYWVEQLRRPVRFAKGVARLLEESDAGDARGRAGRQLTGLTKQSAAQADPPASSRSAARTGPSSLLLPAGQLWIAGVAARLERVPRGRPRRRVPLPTYPFERKRHWVDRGRRAWMHR